MDYITKEKLEKYRECFSKDIKNKMSMNAVMNNNLDKVASNSDVIKANRNEFSVRLEQGDITDQKMSGRCWMFAALNIMRYEVIKKLNLDNFEFSQSYPLFFDKLEKSNYFLEAVLDNLDEPLNGRLMAHLLFSPLNDGGQWDMFCNIVKKYGAVPKDAMPECISSSRTREMNYYLTSKLRQFACSLREKHECGADEHELREIKNEMMYDIYKILCICLGEPPETVDFEIRDKNKNFIRDLHITPKEFFDKYVGWQLDDYISLINAPTSDKPFNRSFTVKYLGNVREGKPVRYLNMESKYLKEAAIAQLADGRPVWFGADVDHGMMAQEGIFDPKAYQAELIFGTDFDMTKEQRLNYGHSMMNHAMVFMGVNIGENGRPDRWRVENSWGKEKGRDGYYIMSDDWFDEYVFQVVVNKKYLPPELLNYYNQEPVVLEPWDPMGSLAD